MWDFNKLEPVKVARKFIESYFPNYDGALCVIANEMSHLMRSFKPTITKNRATICEAESH